MQRDPDAVGLAETMTKARGLAQQCSAAWGLGKGAGAHDYRRMRRSSAGM